MNKTGERIKGPGKHLLVVIIVISCFFTYFTKVSQAGEMPAYERLDPVTGNMDAPTAVALDHYECLFVAESINNRVLIYSQSGQYMETIEGLNRPISVAVDDAVRVYIGNKDSRNVEVYDAGHTMVFKLGAGDGEFTQPNDIEIDTSGTIYVVDKGEDRVKMYNPDGTYMSSLGSSGNADGEFHSPTSIAIDNTAGELIVLDHQETQDMFGNTLDGARIQVFGMSGEFRRSFSPYGNEIGQLFRPQHIAVDSQSRIYVTDSFHNVVIVYDSSGTYLGDLYDENAMRTPMGITIGKSNRLYIASLLTKKVEVYGIGMYTRMGISPLRLHFEGREGAGNPPAQSIEISNRGTGVLNWTAGTQNSWITLTEDTGSVEPMGMTAIEAGVNLNGLTVGTYTGSIGISGASGATEIVDVELEISPNPELFVTPLSLTFRSTNGSVPASEILTITNTGAGTLNWNASGDRSWIVIDRTGGTAPDTLEVTVDVSSVTEGTYTGSITITGDGALRSPAVIPVTLMVEEVTGTINVTANIAEATYRINGPESYIGSGVHWIKEETLTGTYAIVYADIEGYITPSSQSHILEADAVIGFHGEYEREVRPQSVRGSIIAGAGPGENNAGIVKVFNADGSESGVAFTAHEYGYGVNVAAGDIDNDGIDEIITAPGPGADNPAEVRIYDKNGNHLMHLDIAPFHHTYGANVAAGDFDGDGHDEVVVGTGAVEGNPAEVRVYVYDRQAQKMVDSGISLLAYDTEYGVRVTTGDIDCDDVDELITVPGSGESSSGLVRVWDVNTSMGAGQWNTEKIKEITGTGQYGKSATISSADVNGDGYADIIAGAGPDQRARDEVRVFDRNGDQISQFRGYVAERHGVNVAGGDLDNDGVAEIVVGAGAGERNRAIVKIFDANGIEQSRFKALGSRYGINVAVGFLGMQ